MSSGNNPGVVKQTKSARLAPTAFASVIGCAVAAILVRGFGPRALAMMLGGAAAGGLCGLLPYFVGRKRDARLAALAVWVCVGSGILFGVFLAIPVALLFTLVLARKPAS
jgi:hypothetical protein